MGLISETIHDFNFKILNTPNETKADHISVSLHIFLGDAALVLAESCGDTHVLKI